jgi:hypothetical protein
MSLIAMQGGATGTGTVTLLAPITNTNRTLTLPDATGTVLSTATAGVPVNGPAFSAYLSTNQSLSAATNTKVTFQTEEFDTASCYDNATNYRFTPTVEGYYQVNSLVSMGGASARNVAVMIYKNGSQTSGKFGAGWNTGGSSDQNLPVSALIYLNGSTDYVEIYAYSSGATTISNGGSGVYYTYFQAALVRSAV